MNTATKTNDRQFVNEITDMSKLNFAEEHETDLFKTFGDTLNPFGLTDQQKKDLQEQEELLYESRRDETPEKEELWSEEDAPSLKELNS